VRWLFPHGPSWQWGLLAHASCYVHVLLFLYCDLLWSTARFAWVYSCDFSVINSKVVLFVALLRVVDSEAALDLCRSCAVIGGLLACCGADDGKVDVAELAMRRPFLMLCLRFVAIVIGSEKRDRLLYRYWAITPTRGEGLSVMDDDEG